MIKKVGFLVLSVFLVSFFLLRNDLVTFYHTEKGNSLFAQENYSGALDHHELALEYGTGDTLHYNIGLDYYKLSEFENAKKFFELIQDTGDKEFLAKKYFALGNTLFWIGEREVDFAKKITDWESSLSHYEKSLSYEDNMKAQGNYEYVKKKLEDLKEKLKNEDEKDPGTESSSSSDKSNTGSGAQDNTSSEEPNTGTGQEDASSDKFPTGSQSGEESGEKGQKDDNAFQQGLPGLTQDEKDYLQGYTEYLQKKQEQNQKFFNKNSDSQSADDIFNMIQNNPFFSSDLPKNDEKDW